MLFRENEIARKAAASRYRKTCIFNRLGYHDLRSVPTWKAQRGAHFARSAQLAWSRDRISSTKSIKGVKPTRRAAGRSWRLAMVEVPDPAPVPTISAVSPSFIRPFIATVVVGRRGQRLTRPTLRPVRFAERSAEGRSRRENTSRIRETSGRINRTDTKELAHTPAASTNPAIGPASRGPARVASAPLGDFRLPKEPSKVSIWDKGEDLRFCQNYPGSGNDRANIERPVVSSSRPLFADPLRDSCLSIARPRCSCSVDTRQ